jgi:hypothetical protein
MKRKVKSKSNIYAYLQSKGVLENGSHEEIQNARKKYWSEYKRNWRNEKRKKEKEFTISLNSDELKIFTKAAKGHEVSRTAFIKQAAFAYINTSFIIPDNIEIRKITQLLAMNYNSIQELIDEEKINTLAGKIVLEKMHELERDILPLLHNPQSLEDCIKNHIQKNEANKFRLLEYINIL